MSSLALKVVSPYHDNIPTSVKIVTVLGNQGGGFGPDYSGPVSVTPGVGVSFQIQYFVGDEETKVEKPVFNITYTDFVSGLAVTKDLYTDFKDYIPFENPPDQPGNVQGMHPTSPDNYTFVKGSKVPYSTGQDPYSPSSKYYFVIWDSSVARPNTTAILSVGYTGDFFPGGVDTFLSSVTLKIGVGQPWLVMPMNSIQAGTGEDVTYSAFVVTDILVNRKNLLNKPGSVIYDPTNTFDITQGIPPLFAPISVQGGYPNVLTTELSGINDSSNLQMFCWTYPVPVAANTGNIPRNQQCTTFFNLAAIAAAGANADQKGQPGWNGTDLLNSISITVFLGSPSLEFWFPFSTQFNISATTYDSKPYDNTGLISQINIEGPLLEYQNGYYVITVAPDLTLSYTDFKQI